MAAVLSETCFKEFLSLVHKLTGITIASNRTSMLEGRLRKRISALGLETYEEYLKLAQDNAGEQKHFIDLVTTNETYFFRTPRVWEYIERKFLPQWSAKHPNQMMKAWSAAASSGEEAHSLGVICQDFKEKTPGFQYQITGTDISGEMIDLCQKGLYSGRSLEAFKKTRPAQFERHMKLKGDNTYQVASEIKAHLKFQQHNLFRAFQTQEAFDLILIRNVLIYFKGPDQETVLSLIAPRLAPEGVLIIGEAESLAHINTGYKSIEPLVYRLDAGSAVKTKAG